MNLPGFFFFFSHHFLCNLPERILDIVLDLEMEICSKIWKRLSTSCGTNRMGYFPTAVSVSQQEQASRIVHNSGQGVPYLTVPVVRLSNLKIRKIPLSRSPSIPGCRSRNPSKAGCQASRRTTSSTRNRRKGRKTRRTRNQRKGRKIRPTRHWRSLTRTH